MSHAHLAYYQFPSAARKKIIDIQKLTENNNRYPTKNLDITKYCNAEAF